MKYERVSFNSFFLQTKYALKYKLNYLDVLDLVQVQATMGAHAGCHIDGGWGGRVGEIAN
jgi:hypothetical protein